MGLEDCFAEYGAKLVNVRWACSAIAENGDLVLCLWQHMLHRPPAATSGLRYEDFFWRWDVNQSGKDLLRKHLQQALESHKKVRLVMACVDDARHRAAIDAGKSADRLPKSFEPRKNLVGKVLEFSDDKFVIEFRRAEEVQPTMGSMA